jgi:peptidoglycan-N-acetylglucosamine deacetylase
MKRSTVATRGGEPRSPLLRRFVLWSLLAVLAAGVALWRLANSRTFQVFGELVARAPCSEPLVALTLDDGPTPDGTEPLLALLERHRVRATFFLEGQQLDRFPELGRRIASAGHQLGNHSYTHARMLLRLPSFLRRELEATDRAIRASGFTGEIYFRPPFGKKLLGLPWLLRQTGRTTVMWDLEPESARGVGATEQEQAAYVLERAQPGSILLLHAMRDPAGFKARVLERVLPGLRERGLRWVTIQELFERCGVGRATGATPPG